MNEQQILNLIRKELANHSDRNMVEKPLTQYLDGRNISFGGGTGTKLGTSVSQKLSLWGVTPVIQPKSANQAVLNLDLDVTGVDTVDKTALNNNFTSLQTLVNQLRSDLIAAGIIKGSA